MDTNIKIFPKGEDVMEKVTYVVKALGQVSLYKDKIFPIRKREESPRIKVVVNSIVDDIFVLKKTQIKNIKVSSNIVDLTNIELILETCLDAVNEDLTVGIHGEHNEIFPICMDAPLTGEINNSNKNIYCRMNNVILLSKLDYTVLKFDIIFEINQTEEEHRDFIKEYDKILLESRKEINQDQKLFNQRLEKIENTMNRIKK